MKFRLVSFMYGCFIVDQLIFHSLSLVLIYYFFISCGDLILMYDCRNRVVIGPS